MQELLVLGRRRHHGSRSILAQRDVAFVAVAPLARIEAFRKRMGWSFKWVSSQGTDFNHDFHVTFTPEEIAGGPVGYNYAERKTSMTELPGISKFCPRRRRDVPHLFLLRGLDDERRLPLPRSRSRRDATRAPCPTRRPGFTSTTTIGTNRRPNEMRYRETAAKLDDYRRQIAELRQKMREAQAAAEPEQVPDYAFTTPQGSASVGAVRRQGGPHRDRQHGLVLRLLHAVVRRLQRHLRPSREPRGLRGVEPGPPRRAGEICRLPRRLALPDGDATPIRPSPPTWATARKTAAGCPESRPSARMPAASCVSQTRRAAPTTTSARCGTCSIFSPRGPRAGSRSTAVRSTTIAAPPTASTGRSRNRISPVRTPVFTN